MPRKTSVRNLYHVYGRAHPGLPRNRIGSNSLIGLLHVSKAEEVHLLPPHSRPIPTPTPRPTPRNPCLFLLKLWLEWCGLGMSHPSKLKFSHTWPRVTYGIWSAALNVLKNWRWAFIKWTDSGWSRAPFLRTCRQIKRASGTKWRLC